MHVEQTVRQTEAILRFTEEVDRRLAEHGIAGVEDLLARYAQVERALSTVSLSELQRARAEAEHLVQRLQQLCSELQSLTMLKSTLEVHH